MARNLKDLTAPSLKPRQLATSALVSSLLYNLKESRTYMQEIQTNLPQTEVIGHERMEVKLQTKDADCCPVAVSAMLATFGIEADYDDLCQQLGTDKSGTSDTAKIRKTLERYGLKVEEHVAATMSDLKSALNKGCYCLIEYQAPDYDYHHDFLWFNLKPRPGKSINHGHYSNACGIIKIDSEERILLMDPLITGETETPYGLGFRAMAEKHFQKRWEYEGLGTGWMLAVSNKEN